MSNVIELKNVKNKSYDPITSLRNEGGERIVAGYFTDDNEFVSYIGNELSFMEMLFVIDSFKRRVDMKVENGEFE